MKTLSEEYVVCRERGRHISSDVMLMSNPPWLVCSMCETHYRYGFGFGSGVIERNVPIG